VHPVEAAVVATSAIAAKANDKLDTVVSNLDRNVSTLIQEVLKDEEVIAASITEIKESVGLDENLKYVVNTNATYISGATSLYEADNLLDAAIKSVSDAAISVVAGDGISVSGNGTEKTITAVAKVKDSLIEVTENGIGIKDNGYIDCGTF
jgi:hypothetical protein